MQTLFLVAYNRFYLLRHLFLSIITLCLMTGCSSDDPEIITDDPTGLTNISVPTDIEMDEGEILTIKGQGFTSGDIIRFTNEKGEYTAKIMAINPDNITYTLPADIPTGTYQVTITRGNKTIHQARTNLTRVCRGGIDADREGMNLKGIVHCSGTPLAGVTVSDGINVTTTDTNGIYYLASNKKSGYVFISLPSGYKALTDGNQPKIFAKLSDDVAKVDRNDFSLIKIPADKDYVVLALADMHLAARTWDSEQYDANLWYCACTRHFTSAPRP